MVKNILSTLVALLAMGGSTPTAKGSPCPAPSLFQPKNAARDSRLIPFGFPAVFQREQGVSWDGRIEWKTPERAWAFASALEGSLKGITRVDSPYHLIVAVVRVETQTGTFVVEFAIQDQSGESMELLQVEGICPLNRSSEEVYRAVAGEIVATFEKSVLK